MDSTESEHTSQVPSTPDVPVRPYPRQEQQSLLTLLQNSLTLTNTLPSSPLHTPLLGCAHSQGQNSEHDGFGEVRPRSPCSSTEPTANDPEHTSPSIPSGHSGAKQEKGVSMTPSNLGPSSSGEMGEWRPSKVALSRFAVVSYGTGHMLNDLTSACWFTYLLIFLTDIGLSPKQAASVMMAGQLADAFATLVVGRLIDRFGHFKAWHLGGSICTLLCFSSVFGGCLICSLSNSSSTLLQAVSYSVFAAVFNVGWAATQVSHMSMVNCITCNPSSRVALNSCRNAFTMVANLTLYGIAFLAFWLLPGKNPIQVQRQFRWIAAGAVAIGLVFVLLFQCGTPEPGPTKRSVRCAARSSNAWLYWFRQLEYYQVALIYTLTRLVCNVSQAILPFFIVRDLNMHQSAKAVVPGMVYAFSFLVSVVLQEMHWTAKRLKMSYTVGASLWILASALFYCVDYHQQGVLYLLAAVMGAASALILVSATSMEGVLVGHRIDGCAFVYGSLSFLDKVTSGIALFAIEATNDPQPFCGSISETCPRSVVRWVLVLLPLICSFLATLIALRTNLDESEASTVVVIADIGSEVAHRSHAPGVPQQRSLTEALLESSFDPAAAESGLFRRER